jgi:hypothetical protein
MTSAVVVGAPKYSQPRGCAAADWYRDYTALDTERSLGRRDLWGVRVGASDLSREAPGRCAKQLVNDH